MRHTTARPPVPRWPRPLCPGIVCAWSVARNSPVGGAYSGDAAPVVTGSATIGAFLPILSVVRIGIATGAAFAVGRVLPMHGKLMSLVEAVIVGLTFLVVLIVTGELGKRDLEAIKAVRRKRATQGDAS